MMVMPNGTPVKRHFSGFLEFLTAFHASCGGRRSDKPNDSCWYSDSGCTRGDIGQDDGIRSDLSVVPNSDATKNFGSSTYIDMPADFRSPMVIPTQCNLLKNQAIWAN